jgi:D-tyrosyl-tRNA(Tyr) deacylase
MRVLIQRVKRGSVTIAGEEYSRIGRGIVILLGVKCDDTEEDAKYLAYRSANLRIFEDQNNKMNLSLLDINGEALVVSQFTLYADTKKGHRPSYTEAAPPKLAVTLYNSFCDYLSETIGKEKIKTGQFRAMMDVEIINDGPVTIAIESKGKSG